MGAPRYPTLCRHTMTVDRYHALQGSWSLGSGRWAVPPSFGTVNLLTTLRDRRWLMPPMALLLVVSTSIPSLWRMYCPEMGSSRTAWVEIRSCCHPERTSDHAEVDMHCCDYTVAQADLSTLEHSAGMRLSHPSFAPDAYAPQLGLRTVPGTGTSTCPERPPPRTGAERAALLQVMRV